MCVQSLVKAADAIKKNKVWKFFYLVWLIVKIIFNFHLKTQNDGELFLIKHLLILREQITPFNNEFSVVEVQLDFTKIRDAAFSLMSKKNKLFHLNRDNAFMDFLLNVNEGFFFWLIDREIILSLNNLKGTLEAKENLIDSKREVDNQLKKSCEMFIENVSIDLFGTVRELVKKVKLN